MVPNGPVPQNFMEKQARFGKMPLWPVAKSILVEPPMKKILLLISLLAFLPLLIRYQRDHGDMDDNSGLPTAAWVLEGARVDKGGIPSTVGNWPLILHAPPQAITAPVEALYFGGGLTGGSVLSQKNRPTPAPKEAISLLAWVRIDAGARKGGIIGRVEDNRYGAGGTYLGYDETHLVFGLTPGGPGIGEGRLHIIRSAKPIDKGIWSLVVATYDGKEMRLFVNGELVAESTDARGPINWYRTDSWSIGRFSDENEKVPMIGAIREVEIYDKALSKESIRARFAFQSARAKTVLGDSPPHFVIAPYLQFPDTNSFRVCLETSSPVTVTIEYGPEAPFNLKTTSKEAATFHEIPIEGLSPGTMGYYRVVCQGPAGERLETAILPWQTAPKESVPFSFAIIGDTQGNAPATGKVADIMKELRPNFALHLGDVVNEGHDKRQWVEELFRPSQELFGQVPLFPTMGNHEKNHPNYYKYFALPAPEYRYSYTWGDAEFFVLDSNKPMGKGTLQYTWLDEAMGKSKAKWKFCYHHHPVYSSDNNDFGDTFAGKRSLFGDPKVRPLATLYEKHKVDIVFCGHVHLYERTHPIKNGKLDEVGGVVYVTSGGGGGSLENFTPTPEWFKAANRVDYHTTLVNIRNSTLELRAFDKDGLLFDQYLRTK